jgi:hypothetical protein
MYHASKEAKDLDGLIKKVTEMYSLRPEVMQVVVVPLFASFPSYDFFLFHRDGRNWMPAAGYQCTLGDELPDKKHTALTNVGLSVWIGGSCRKYRVDAGTRVPQTEKYGWVLMGADRQVDMLGVSISEALPHYNALLSILPCDLCDAENSLQDRRNGVNAESKRLKTS